MQKDPGCGMSVDTDEAENTSTYMGMTYYFCSSECKKAFDERPAQFSTKVG